MSQRACRRRVLLLGALDIVVAGVVALLVFSIFGAVSADDTNPPVCHNRSGGVVSCSLTQSALMLPTFGVVLLGLGAWQVTRTRKRRSTK